MLDIYFDSHGNSSNHGKGLTGPNFTKNAAKVPILEMS